MRIKNISADLYRRNALSITARDISSPDVLACCANTVSLRALLVSGGVISVASGRSAGSFNRAAAWIANTWRAGLQYAPVSKQAPKKMPRVASREACSKTARM